MDNVHFQIGSMGGDTYIGSGFPATYLRVSFFWLACFMHAVPDECGQEWCDAYRSEFSAQLIKPAELLRLKESICSPLKRFLPAIKVRSSSIIFTSFEEMEI